MSTNNDNCEFSSAPSGFIWRRAACRDFLKATTISLALVWLCVGCTASKPSIARFGIVSDCHYADKNSANSRYYRESLAKLAECVEVMNKQEVDFLIELGDFIDKPNRQLNACQVADDYLVVLADGESARRKFIDRDGTMRCNRHL